MNIREIPKIKLAVLGFYSAAMHFVSACAYSTAVETKEPEIPATARAKVTANTVNQMLEGPITVDSVSSLSLSSQNSTYTGAIQGAEKYPSPWARRAAGRWQATVGSALWTAI